MESVPLTDLKLPLEVQFEDELGHDVGGIKREFFLLLQKDILDPKYGLFKTYEETQTIWFHPWVKEIGLQLV